MVDPETLNQCWLEPHLTDYVRDPNISAQHRGEARRVLALEAALTTSRQGATILSNARKIEEFLRGNQAELREVSNG